MALVSFVTPSPFPLYGAVLTLRSAVRSEEHTSELQSHSDLVCRLLLEKKKGWHPRKAPTREARPLRVQRPLRRPQGVSAEYFVEVLQLEPIPPRHVHARLCS